jgi:hypothetical protein
MSRLPPRLTYSYEEGCRRRARFLCITARVRLSFACLMRRPLSSRPGGCSRVDLLLSIREVLDCTGQLTRAAEGGAMSTEPARVVQSVCSPDPCAVVEVQARLERLGFTVTQQSATEIAAILQSAPYSQQSG